MADTPPYKACLEAMYGLRRFGIKLGLSTIKNLLSGLGNPQETFSAIHVAGSNGKGSTASMLAAILCASGHKVGLYTSPHLVRFNERIRINNREISDDRVVRSYEDVMRVHQHRQSDREPTFFEITTAMAFDAFGREKVDWAVIETGMGGRLDATNVLIPEVSIITNISLEHRNYLGNTINKIAYEKGGIIKDGVPVVTGARQKSAISMLEDISRKRKAPLYRLGKDFRVRRDPKGYFAYYGLRQVWRGLTTALPGSHQIDNASLALAACEIMSKSGTRISKEAIKKGISENHWPGRMEIVATSPTVILDGAHNLAAARQLAGYLSKNLIGRKITLIIGILDDKPYEAMLRSLVPVSRRIILTRPGIERALAPEILHSVVKPLNSEVVICPVVADAVKHALDTAAADEVICVAGSLYVVGEAKAYFEKTASFAV